jgi:hypothetical protein
MPIRVALGREQLGRRFSAGIKRERDKVLGALRQTASDAATEIEDKGRANISSAGRFGHRWTEGFHARVSEGGGFIRIGLSHDVPYWTVFQFGRVIHGKPLLWIPLSFATDAQGVLARNFPEPLFRVERLGRAPLLLTKSTGQPKYFGKEQVTIPKKFRLLEIAAEVSRRMSNIYRRNFRTRRR